MVFLVLGAVVVLLLSEKLPMEVVGFLSLLALTAVGAISQKEALEGFSNGIVVTMAGLFVLGGALVKTGTAQKAGDLMERGSGGKPGRLLLLVILVSATLSTVLSSTGTVALLIPAVVRASMALGRSPSKYLIPLAFGSLIGGMLTLVGGTPNLIAQESVLALGRDGFGFFSFAWIGGPILLLAVVYLMLVGERWLPDRVEPLKAISAPSIDDLLSEYGVSQNLFKVELPPESAWRPATLESLRLRSDHQLDVLAVRERGTGLPRVPAADTLLSPGMVVFVRSSVEALERFRERYAGVAFRPFPYDPASAPSLAGRGLAELLLVPRSRLEGKSLAESRFFRTYGVRVLQIRRSGQGLKGPVGEVPLRFGDALLVEGPLAKLADLQRERFDFVVVGAPRGVESSTGLGRDGWTALLIAAVMLLAITAGWASSSMAALCAAVAVVLAGCLTVEEAYDSLPWGSLFLVATMLPLGTALSNSGGVDFLTHGLLTAVGGYGPHAVLAGLYLLSTVLGQVMSNTATALLLTPLALDAARLLGVAPEPLLMGIAFGAAMAFLTPIASPVNTLVVTPGGYRFADFLKIGLPLHLMASAVCLLGIPVAFPFELGGWEWPAGG